MEYEDKSISAASHLKSKVEGYSKLLDKLAVSLAIEKFIEDQGWPKWTRSGMAVTALRNGYGQLRSVIITYESDYNEVTQRIVSRAGIDLFGFEYQVEPKETN